jgi:hypothetical protein
VNGERSKLFWIKAAYWLGIAADVLWTVGLAVPRVFGSLTGRPSFAPDPQVRSIMGIGASLMAGWTLLLLWAVREPIERRTVALLTAFPVISGLFVATLIGFLAGNAFSLWILAKLILIFALMITSYVLAGRVNQEA